MKQSINLAEERMFLDTEELKEFIVWAKSQGIQALTVGDVSLQFSPYALLEQAEGKAATSSADGKPPAESPSEEEDLLYWSAR